MADDDKVDETPADDFDEDFDAERAKRLIRNLRTDKAALKRERDAERDARVAAEKERDDAVKSAGEAKKELASDRRAAILKEFEIDEDMAEEFLSGDLTLDELRRKAERLAGRKPAEKKEDPKPEEPAEDGDSKDDEPSDDLPSRPKPALSKGSGAAPKPDLDLDAIAKAARRH